MDYIHVLTLTSVMHKSYNETTQMAFFQKRPETMMIENSSESNGQPPNEWTVPG